MNLRHLLLVLCTSTARLAARDIVAELTLPKGETFEVKGVPALNQPILETAQRFRIKPKARVVVEIIREFRYPIEFAPPKITDFAAAEKGKGGITPQTPLTFETTNVGWTFELTGEEGPDFITLKGEAIHYKGEMLQATHGEAAVPIIREFRDAQGKKKTEVLSPNAAQSAVLESTKTKFQVYAAPGKEYKIPVRRGGKTIQITVRCDYAK